MTLILVCIIIYLISNNEIITTGARNGLLLWYQNVVPLLLPFILISKLMLYSHKKKNAKHSNPILIIFFMGLLCGYPIGALLLSGFLKEKKISEYTANILLPIVNSSSPMFIFGFIGTALLKNQLKAAHILLLLYLPYMIYLAFSCLFMKFFLNHRAVKSNNSTYQHKNKKTDCSGNTSTKITENNSDLLMDSIKSITIIGMYIMLCSIIIELMSAKLSCPYMIKNIIIAATEITSGTRYICTGTLLNNQKTALILAATSFGGVSSILQTKHIAKSKELSIIYYSFIKLICACATYFLALIL